MTIDIDAIRRREQAATPGPWWAWNRMVGWHIATGDPRGIDEYGRPLNLLPEGDRTDIGREADAEFIAHARTDIPALLAKVGELKGELKRAREALAEDGDLVDQTAAARDRFRRERDAEREAKDKLRAELDRVRADLAAAHNHAHRTDAEIQRLTRDGIAYANENLRLREQIFAQKPVIEAAQAWAEMCEDGGIAPDDCRKTEDALFDAVEQYRLMDLALTTARDEAEVAR